MADVKISELPTGAASDADEMVIVDGAATKKISLSALSAYLRANGWDVTGTVTADGLVVDAAGGNGKLVLENAGTPRGCYIGVEGYDDLVLAADEDNLGTGSVMKFRVDASEKMRINSSGRVGIGTSSPTRRFDVSGSGSSILANFKNTGGTTSFITLGNTTSTADQIRIGSDGTNLVMSTNYAERARIDSSGNLLVGKTSSDTASVGHELRTNGVVTHTSGGVGTMYLNRTTSDGDILTFRKDNTTVGSIGTFASDLTIGDADIGIRFDTGHGLVPWNMSTNLSTDGIVKIGASTARVGDIYTSGGVYLGGTGAANKLDDYEAGTFTPTMATSNGNGAYTYYEQTGEYTKIGDLVTFYIRLSINTVTTTGTGTVRLSGLPFTNGSRYGQGNLTYKVNWSTNGPDYGRIPSGGSWVDLKFDNNTSEANVLSTHVTTNTDIIMTGSYRV